jgi:PAS domain S-box-containing protein
MPSVSENEPASNGTGPFAGFSVAHVATAPRNVSEPATVRYGVALVVVAVSVLMSVWLEPFSHTTPFLFLYPAVLLAAWFGGLGPGLFATAVASLAAHYFLLPPYHHFGLEVANVLRTVFFALTFGSVCWLTELARRHVYSRDERLQEALRHSEERLHAAAMAAEIGVWFWNTQTGQVEVSANWRRLFGVAPETEVTFDTWRNALHPDDRDRAVNALMAASEQHHDFYAEYRVVCPDGVVRWIVDRGRATYDEQGRPISMAGVNVDISKRKQAEARVQQLNQALTQRNAELDAERARWQGVVEGIADEVWVCDARGKISLLNLPAVTHMGLEEFRGKTILEVLEQLEVLHTDGRPRPPEQAPLFRSLQGEIVRGEELMRHRSTGNMRHRQFSSAPTRDASGAITGAVAIMRDITDAKLAEQQLQLQSAALESAANAIVITDCQGVILWCNPAFTEMTGYTAEEVQGRTPRMLRSGEHDSQFYANMWQTILSGTVWHGEVVNRRKSGSLYVEEMTITPVRSERGEITHFIAIKVDVTERKRAEQAMIRSEKLAATGRLAATIAHEINNPLEAMTNLLYLIGPSITDPTAREYFEMMRKQLQAVSRIASQTLNFHRENSRPAEFSLSEVISESLEFYQPKAKKHGVTISGRLETGADLVGFSGEIRQVVSNLLLNAIEATPAGGKIMVYLHESFDWRNPARRGYRITVLDTGCGIEPQHRARIFEPFFTTKGEKGTGLGLWVSFGIVQRAGGSMRVWSARRPERSGTCFSVFLPTEVPTAAGLRRRRYEAVPAPDTAPGTA